VIPDPVVALIAYLRSNAALTVLIGTRVFGAELPENQVAFMPQRSVVLRRAGGGLLMGEGYMRLGDFRLDVTCYGETPYQASQVNLALYEALKQMRRNVQGSALLHWANPSGGGIALRDPDAEWPLVFSSWQVLASEQEVPA
jgi:hypothetical protein